MSPVPFLQFLVIAHPEDELALRVFRVLRAQHGDDSTLLVAAQELSLAQVWSHTVENGGCHTSITLRTGVVIDSTRIGVVFNRLVVPPMPHFSASRNRDREYAQQEMQALWLSWLSSLPCPVVNPATARGMCAPWLSELEWLWLSARAGLQTRSYHATTNCRVFCSPDLVAYPSSDARGWHSGTPVPFANRILGVNPAIFLEPLEQSDRVVVFAGGAIVGDCLTSEREAIRNLALLSGCDLLQVSFGRSHDPNAGGDYGWRVRAASGMVQFADPRVVEAISAVLTTKARK